MTGSSCRFSATRVSPPRQPDALLSSVGNPAERLSREIRADARRFGREPIEGVVGCQPEQREAIAAGRDTSFESQLVARAGRIWALAGVDLAGVKAHASLQRSAKPIPWKALARITSCSAHLAHPCSRGQNGIYLTLVTAGWPGRHSTLRPQPPPESLMAALVDVLTRLSGRIGGGPSFPASPNGPVRFFRLRGYSASPRELEAERHAGRQVVHTKFGLDVSLVEVIVRLHI